MQERAAQEETMRRENRRVQAMSWGECCIARGQPAGHCFPDIVVLILSLLLIA